MQYDLIEDTDYRSFLQRVRAALAEGWALHGGTQVVAVHWQDRVTIMYAQAVVKA